jgi:lactoylglutathione lyase
MNIAINHILLRTHDLEEMGQFFEQSLDLKKGYRPPFNFPGSWLWSDDKPLIHLTELNPADTEQSDHLGGQRTIPNTGMGTVDHIAFSGSDYPRLIARLKHHHLDYFERAVPLTGEHQVFVEGPEEVRVEIQFDSNQLARGALKI